MYDRMCRHMGILYMTWKSLKMFRNFTSQDLIVKTVMQIFSVPGFLNVLMPVKPNLLYHCYTIVYRLRFQVQGISNFEFIELRL